ncbi:hypothetical protein SDC9_80303 [bioreactor metagenome]|uniref:Uncharacterized protein n=1 Tax=bioreactor metagenome TaxID=1076179 RepID=A0A644YYM5_9ZZZZ
MLPEARGNALGEHGDGQVDILVVDEVARGGNAVADGLDGLLIDRMQNGRRVQAVGERVQHHAALAELRFEKRSGRGCQIPDGEDAVGAQLCLRGAADVQ